MGDVVRLRSDPVDPQWAAWVRCVCGLAGQDGRAEDYIARGTSRARIVADLRALTPSLRQGDQAVTYLREMRGRAGTARHALPIHPQPHGVRRRPDRPGPA